MAFLTRYQVALGNEEHIRRPIDNLLFREDSNYPLFSQAGKYFIFGETCAIHSVINKWT